MGELDEGARKDCPTEKNLLLDTDLLISLLRYEFDGNTLKEGLDLNSVLSTSRYESLPKGVLTSPFDFVTILLSMASLYHGAT